MKKAFTLAEALIALMIIGVIAALILRTLNRVTPDKEKVMYIKAYHTLEQVVADTINDPSKYDQEIGAASAADFSQAPLDLWGTSISGASGCNSVGQSNALCCFMADKVNIIGTGNCSANDNFTTTNGIKWSGVNGGSYPKTITVDVNGDEDGGTYSIIVNSDGKVYPPSGGKEEEFYLQDRYQARFPVKIDCRHCMNTVYNSVPLSLHQYAEEIVRSGALALRLDFTVEGRAETKGVLDLFCQGGPVPESYAYTTGHYKKGVE